MACADKHRLHDRNTTSVNTYPDPWYIFQYKTFENYPSRGPRASIPMSQIPSNVSQIVAVFVECILYGIYLVTFTASLQSIASSHPGLSWASRFKNKWPMLMVVLLLFILSTLNLVLGLLRIIAFIHHDIVGSGEAEQLGQDWLNILKVSPSHFSISTLSLTARSPSA